MSKLVMVNSWNFFSYNGKLEIQLLQVIAAFEQISCPKEEENLDFGVKKERVYAETLSISLDISGMVLDEAKQSRKYAPVFSYTLMTKQWKCLGIH